MNGQAYKSRKAQKPHQSYSEFLYYLDNLTETYEEERRRKKSWTKWIKVLWRKDKSSRRKVQNSFVDMKSSLCSDLKWSTWDTFMKFMWEVNSGRRSRMHFWSQWWPHTNINFAAIMDDICASSRGSSFSDCGLMKSLTEFNSTTACGHDDGFTTQTWGKTSPTYTSLLNQITI